MKTTVAAIVCFLAALVLGLAELRPLSTGSCSASDSCCCSDPATVAPCLCDDFPTAEFPEMAAFSGLVHLAVPVGEKLRIGEINALEGLRPSWHPALPWHAPPEEKRARLSVWIL